MKRKNLEKAIIMSLLAASVSVPVWADNITQEGGFYNGNVNIDEGMTNEETYTINANISGKPITGIGYNGTFDIGDGNLIINAGENGIASGWMDNATLNIYADNIDITAGKNGIFTAIEEGYSGTVVIGLEDSNSKIDSLTIKADGQGIDNKNGSVRIYGSEGSLISFTSTGTEGYREDGYLEDDQAAIGNGHSSGTAGETVIKGGTVSLTAERGSGIINQTEGSSTTINATNSVTIVSDNIEYQGVLKNIDNASIKNLAGTTKIDAVNGIFIDSSNNGIYAAGGTVTLNGGSINRIDAVSNGIYASGKNTNVTLEAENNGIYVENNDGGATGVHTENGATKDIISKGETEIIVSGTKDNILGIHADKNSTVKVDAGALSIDVTSKGSSDSQLSGILVGALNNRNGNATVTATVVGDIDIDVYAVKCDANGIRVNVDSDLDLTSNNGDINIKGVIG